MGGVRKGLSKGYHLLKMLAGGEEKQREREHPRLRNLQIERSENQCSWVSFQRCVRDPKCTEMNHEEMRLKKVMNSQT